MLKSGRLPEESTLEVSNIYLGNLSATRCRSLAHQLIHFVPQNWLF